MHRSDAVEAILAGMPVTTFAPAARRAVELWGAPAELVWVPERRRRSGIPGRKRPAFREPVAERILTEEVFWSDGMLAATPNRYPFGRSSMLLWETAPVREAGVELLATAFALEEATGGTAVLNTIGAAASIPRAHAHLMGERLPFLPALPEEPWQPAAGPPADGVRLVRKTRPFPGIAVGVTGPADARARAVHDLLGRRTTAAVNLVAQDGTAWIFPRNPTERVAGFPYALGAAELWGRWCYPDEEAFTAAAARDLEGALARACLAAHD